MRVFYSDNFEADIGDHIMPMQKFSAVRNAILAEGLPFELTEPAAAKPAHLARVHTPEYIEAVRTGQPRALAESQKFPWSPTLAESVLWTNGAVVAAAAAAMDDGGSAALCSGFHHAHADHGEGFCTFNGLVIALEDLRHKRRIQRGLIIDLDLHYGNGTVALLEERPWVFNLSVYGSWYEGNRASDDVVSRRDQDTSNCWSIPLNRGTAGPEYLQTVADSFVRALDHARPDIILYQAGADPYREDPYSALDLGVEDLYERDALVLAAARDAGIPIAWVLAGGYTPDLDRVVRVHLGTFRAAAQVFFGGAGDDSPGR